MSCAPRHPAYLRVRDAANIATAVLPGPVGEFLRRELGEWCHTGWRYDSYGSGPAIADDLLARHAAQAK